MEADVFDVALRVDNQSSHIHVRVSALPMMFRSTFDVIGNLTTSLAYNDVYISSIV